MQPDLLTTTPRRTNGEALGTSCALVKAHSKYSHADFRTVAAAALSSANAVLARWLPDGKREGHEYKARNPRRADNRPNSFSINTNTGKWSDFATGDKGGDLVSLVAYLDGCNQGEAAESLGQFLGLRGAGLSASAPGQPGQPGQPATARVSAAPAVDGSAGAAGAAGANDAALVAPAPDDAPPWPDSHPTRGRPSKVWIYPDADGRVLMLVFRFDRPDGRKDFAPLTLWRVAGACRWQWKGLPEPRPLYGLDRLAARPDAPVLICEGEKAADAAGELLPSFVAVTSPNGAKSGRKAAWSPLAGRRALIWPDADEPGAAYATDVERLARKAGASVARLDLAALAELRGSPLPEGWDAADAVAEGMVAGALERLSTEALERMEADDHRKESDVVAVATDSAGGRLPCFELVEYVKGRRNGIYWCGIERDKMTGEERPAPPIWICSPLRITASTRDERGNEWGRYLEWNDRDGRAHRWAMPMRLLHQGSGDEVRGALASGGVEIASHPSDRRRLNDYISWANPSVTARAVTRTGWHGAAFVLPDRTIGDAESEPIHYQAATSEGVSLGTAGNLDRWRETVAALCAGNSRLVLALSAGFAATCLGLIAQEGFGIHYRGDSSAGKTTGLLVAASIWGPPDFKRTWRATGNALEGIAALHSDLLLCLDEMGELSPKDAGATAYMLANGSGKNRAHRDGSARAASRWRVLFLSTGEIGLSELIAEAGGRARAGQEVRAIDLPADAGARLGIFEKLPAGRTPGGFADELREAAATHYGHAGPAFVARLVAAHGGARDALRAAREAIALILAPADAVGQVRRVAGHFALIAAAGELATEWGLTGWREGEAEAAALACFRAWIGARGTVGAAEPAAMLGQVRRFLEAHGESRFAPWDAEPADRPTINRAGFRKPTQDGSGFEFFVLPEAFKSELCAGFDHRAIARVLIDAGVLMADSDGGATRRERLPGMGNARCFRILPAIWSKGDA